MAVIEKGEVEADGDRLRLERARCALTTRATSASLQSARPPRRRHRPAPPLRQRASAARWAPASAGAADRASGAAGSPISRMSRKPFVTSSAARAPLRVRKALVATVKPWTKRSISPGVSPAALRDALDPRADGIRLASLAGGQLLHAGCGRGVAVDQHEIGEGAADIRREIDHLISPPVSRAWRQTYRAQARGSTPLLN